MFFPQLIVFNSFSNFFIPLELAFQPSEFVFLITG